MLDILLSVCLMTRLQCDDIHFHLRANLPIDVYAMAGIDKHGEYHIGIDRDVRRKPNSFKRAIAVHEMAHLLVYEIDPTDTSHGELYQTICRDLAEKAGIHKRSSVCDSHHASGNSVFARMRRR